MVWVVGCRKKSVVTSTFFNKVFYELVLHVCFLLQQHNQTIKIEKPRHHVNSIKLQSLSSCAFTHPILADMFSSAVNGAFMIGGPSDRQSKPRF